MRVMMMMGWRKRRRRRRSRVEGCWSKSNGNKGPSDAGGINEMGGWSFATRQSQLDGAWRAAPC